MIKRAIFVLTSPEAGGQFLRVLPDLRGIGLAEATILHLMPAGRGPAEPLPGLANWVRHFEAALPNVELALKRGDPVKWISELARVRGVDIVVISGAPDGTDWDLERVSSPLRSLGIPILYLPPGPIAGSLSDQILVAVKTPESFEQSLAGLQEWFGLGRLRAVRVAASRTKGGRRECSGVELETITNEGDVATTLLHQAQRCNASLLTILTEDETDSSAYHRARPVVGPLIETAERPVLIWPATRKARV